MKRILALVIVCTLPGRAVADDDYSHIVYTSTAFMYWCIYNKTPRSIEDFAKVTNVKHSDPRITLGVDEWFKSVQLDVEGKNLKITRKVETIKNGRVQTIHTSTSTSDCESFKPPLKQPNKPLEPTP